MIIYFDEAVMSVSKKVFTNQREYNTKKERKKQFRNFVNKKQKGGRKEWWNR